MDSISPNAPSPGDPNALPPSFGRPSAADFDFEEWLPDTDPLEVKADPAGADEADDDDFGETDSAFGDEAGPEDDIWHDPAAPGRHGLPVNLPRPGVPPVGVVAAIGLILGLALSALDPGGPVGYIQSILFPLLGRAEPVGSAGWLSLSSVGDVLIIVAFVLLLSGLGEAQRSGPLGRIGEALRSARERADSELEHFSASDGARGGPQ